MMHSPTIEEVAHWREKQELKAHNYLEELGKPDDLNDLIMIKVNLMQIHERFCVRPNL